MGEFSHVPNVRLCVQLEVIGITGLHLEVQSKGPVITVSEYQTFADDVNNALERIDSTESIVLLRNSNVHIRTDNEVWKSVCGSHEDPEFSQNGRY